MDPLQILQRNESWSIRLARGASKLQIGGKLLGANFNVTTDQQILLPYTANIPFRISGITVTNASVSLTTAAGGVYTAVSKGGTAVVAATQAYSTLTAANLALDLTIVAGAVSNTVWPAGTPLYLSLTTAQGAAATADVYIYLELF